MKKFTIEIKRESYINMEVEAEDKEHAEAQAWAEVEMRGDNNYADWNITLLEEVK